MFAHKFAMVAVKVIGTRARIPETGFFVVARGTVETWKVEAFVAIDAAPIVARHHESVTATGKVLKFELEYRILTRNTRVILQME